ncbi:MAG: hypothetical protein NVS4B10_00050 [Myxococcales bacterium]
MYLDHHYILDLLIGFALALLVMGAFRLLFGPLPDRSAQPARLLDEPTASA